MSGSRSHDVETRAPGGDRQRLREQRARRSDLRRALCRRAGCAQAGDEGESAGAGVRGASSKGRVRTFDGAEPAQQSKRRRQTIGAGVSNHSNERGSAPHAMRSSSGPRDRRAQFRVRDGAAAGRAHPTAAGPVRPQPGRAARALIGRILRHALERQAVDAALGIVARHFHLSGVDDGRHAGHGERRFSDVRGKNDPAPIGGADRGVLRIAVERSVERHDVDR